MTLTGAERSRVAYCECGAALVGGTQAELFEATQAHLAHHHPELLGAFGARVVEQMAEDRSGGEGPPAAVPAA
jgi:hypothetical protein